MNDLIPAPEKYYSPERACLPDAAASGAWRRSRGGVHLPIPRFGCVV